MRRRRAGALVLWLPVLACVGACADLGLGSPQLVAGGVRLYHLTDPSLLDTPGPIAIDLLRLDPARVELRSALANDEVMGTEAVLDLSLRHGAAAAVNAGFFLPNGDPAGVMKIDGVLVSEAARTRGAVGVHAPAGRGPQAIVFDRLSVDVWIGFEAGDGPVTMTVDGVDTTRRRGALMLFTPRYHPDTDTADGGTEWVVRGTPLTVSERRPPGVGRTPIPPDGAVLSFGGTTVPPPLDALQVGHVITLTVGFHPQLGSSTAAWSGARDIVGGAGLLRVGGRTLADWTEEQLREGFTTERHPRTMIGVGSTGEIWLVTVDGRQPGHSVGMTFAELQRLADRLDLRDALNLDGGGSTTMVVGDRIVNRPSDPEGPRKVSDALLVFARGPRG